MVRRLAEHCGICWQALHRFATDHGFEHAGNLAFLGTLALFPFLIFLLALSGLFGQTKAGREAITFLLANLPADIAATLAGPIDTVVSSSGGGLLTGAVAFALYISVDGVEAARKTVIHAYDSWEHAAPIWRRLLADLALIVASAVLIMAAMSLIVLVPWAIDLVERVVHLPPRIHDYSFWARYLAAPLLLFFTLLALYRLFAPRLPERRRYYLPGALLTVIVWLVLGKTMALFLRHADRYDIIYGSLAGIVLVQLFFFLVASAFILGAHLNAAYSRRRGGCGDGAILAHSRKTE